MTYVDHFIVSVLDQLRDKKAIVFYAADHGESINEREHLHGTPRKMAPPEQFRVPMMVWMSDKYLENPDHAAAFAHLPAAGCDEGAAPSRRAVRHHYGLPRLYLAGWRDQ
ncbi:phosphoethanolamine transferase [Klebsiella pneumoniae]|uniref:Phosphoethanolamine transferase n=1 Tax=Klebsiella pneumoniae TaxID=573 RepID=A0A377XG79_KLEPN|nr:phosphoethanolamine transferase [Klebsiella pneumoniae]